MTYRMSIILWRSNHTTPRFSDIYRLKWVTIVGKELIYSMHKSRSRAGTKRILPLIPKVIAIIKNIGEWILFCLSSSLWNGQTKP